MLACCCSKTSEENVSDSSKEGLGGTRGRGRRWRWGQICCCALRQSLTQAGSLLAILSHCTSISSLCLCTSLQSRPGHVDKTGLEPGGQHELRICKPLLFWCTKQFSCLSLTVKLNLSTLKDSLNFIEIRRVHKSAWVEVQLSVESNVLACMGL